MTKKTFEQPTSGGSYIRHPDGKLEKQPVETKPAPAKAAAKKKGLDNG